MKAHIGADEDSGLIHGVFGTAANATDATQVVNCCMIKKTWLLPMGVLKSKAQPVTLFALSNSWLARRHWLTDAGEVCLYNAEIRASPDFCRQRPACKLAKRAKGAKVPACSELPSVVTFGVYLRAIEVDSIKR